MPDRLAVTEDNRLTAIPVTENPSQPDFLRVPAMLFSYIFHPLFVPVYLMLFLVYLQPQLFASFTEWDKLKYLLQVFVNCSFLPMMSVLLLWRLKFIDSVFIKTQKERITPYVISMIFYFWNWYVFKNLNAQEEIVSFSLAVFIASIIGFMANIYIKVSMHAIAMGVACTFISMLTLSQSTNLTLYLAGAILVAGMVCTSRLIVSDHTPREVFLGFFFGVIAQLAAHYFIY